MPARSQAAANPFLMSLDALAVDVQDVAEIGAAFPQTMLGLMKNGPSAEFAVATGLFHPWYG
jgi:hypothetical protein